MSTSGLMGKTYIGKIVEGFDPENRGRYYVHVPGLLPHIAESKGILCTNSTHSHRLAKSPGGMSGFGGYTPLHVGTDVEVECQTDDINGARIRAVVSDDQPNSDMSPGKLMGVDPAGNAIQVIVNGIPDNIFDPNPYLSTVSNLINSGTAEGLKFLGPVLDKINNLGNFSSGLKNMFKNAVAQIPGAENLPLDKVAGLLPDFSIPSLPDLPIPVNETHSSRFSIPNFGMSDLIPQIPNFDSFAQIPMDLNSISLDVFDIKEASSMFDNLMDMSKSLLKDIAPVDQIKDAISGNLTNELLGKARNLSIVDQGMKIATTTFGSIKDQLTGTMDPSKYKETLDGVRNLKVGQLMSALPGGSLPSFNELTQSQQQMIDISLGILNKTKFLNKMSEQFYATGSMFGSLGRSDTQIIHRMVVAIDGEQATYEYENGAPKEDNKERDEQYTAIMSPGQTGIFINENTKENPESLNIMYANKETAIRANSEGILISTKHNSRQKIQIDREIEVDKGHSKITIRKGSYCIYVENGTVQIKSKQAIGIESTESSIYLTAKKNIGLFAQEGSIVLNSDKASIYAHAQNTIHMATKEKQIVMDIEKSSLLAKAKRGMIFHSTDEEISFKADKDAFNVDAKKVNINSGKAISLGDISMDPGKTARPVFEGSSVPYL